MSRPPQPERREPVCPVKVTKLCSVCQADMQFTGRVQACAPPRYVHTCSADPTHPQEGFDRQYPAVIFLAPKEAQP